MSYSVYIVVDVPDKDVETVARYEGFSVTPGPIIRFRYLDERLTAKLGEDSYRQCLIYGAVRQTDGDYFAGRLASGLHANTLADNIDQALAQAALLISYHSPDHEFVARLNRIVEDQT